MADRDFYTLSSYFATQISTNRPRFVRWGIIKYVYEVHAHETHARDMHDYEMHDHEVHALEMHARKVLGVSRVTHCQING